MGRRQPLHYPGVFLRTERLSLLSVLNKRLAETNNSVVSSLPQKAANFPSDSMNVEGVAASHATTIMTDDAVKVKATQEAALDISEAYLKLTPASQSDSIKRFLAKPQIVVRGNLSSSDVGTTFLPYPMPSTLLNKKLVADKVRGYYGFRATLVFTLQVNAERFQQGRYMLTWTPLGGSRYSVGAPGLYWQLNHSSTIVQRTQLPRVELDLNCDTTAELRIPYASILDYYPLAGMTDPNLFGSLGILRLFPYYALESVAGPTTASYTIWGHFEDVELIGAAMPQDAQFQSNYQSKVTKKNKSIAEAESVGAGPISSMAFNISRAAKFFNPVPMLGNYSDSLSWAADIIGNSASVFGWSAPANMSPATQVIRRVFPFSTNVNKVDNSAPLSLDTTNQVDVMPGFGGTNSDELDIPTFVGRPFYNYGFSFPATAVAGTNLASWNVCPMDDIASRTIGGIVVWDMGPCQYLALKFSYWRGSMKYKFKICKTEFHSGRIAVTFTPFASKTVQVPFNALGVDFVHRDIIDIREHSEFEITVPYISSTPYRPTDTRQQGFSMGIFSIDVVDPLISPDTVPTSIRFLVEMSMCEDAEFAGVSDWTFTPAGEVEFQSAFQSQNQTCSILSKTIGNSNPGVCQIDTAKAAIGEKITNLRLLLKKFTPLVANTSTGTGKYLRVMPYCFPFTHRNAGVSSVVTIPDFMGELGSMFMFNRGGVRLKFIPSTAIDTMCTIFETTKTPSVVQNIVTAGASTIGGTAGNLDLLLAKSNYAFTKNVENYTEVQIPQYMYCHSRNNCDDAIGNSIISQTNAVGSLTSPFTVTFTEAKYAEADRANLSGVVLRGASDDFNFSYFISIPPMRAL